MRRHYALGVPGRFNQGEDLRRFWYGWRRAVPDFRAVSPLAQRGPADRAVPHGSGRRAGRRTVETAGASAWRSGKLEQESHGFQKREFASQRW